MSRFLGRDSRRRRVLNEDALSASTAHLALRAVTPDEPSDGTPRYSEAAGVEHHPQVTDFVPRKFRTIGMLAAAALMFPIGIAAADQLGIDARPFVIAITVAASGGFVSPIGYQTHLMVFGPGGYRQSDFLRVGLPMGLLWFATAWLVIPLAWPLR